MDVVAWLKASAVAALLLLILGTLARLGVSGARDVVRAVRSRLHPPAPPKTRLTADQVRALVDAARGCFDPRFGCVVRGASPRDGRLVWSVWSATKGSGWTVEVDDASGAVGPFKRWGIR